MTEKSSRQSFSELSHRERYLQVRLTSIEQYRIDNQQPLLECRLGSTYLPASLEKIKGVVVSPSPLCQRCTIHIPEIDAAPPGAFGEFDPTRIHARAAYA